MEICCRKVRKGPRTVVLSSFIVKVVVEEELVDKSERQKGQYKS